MQDNCKYCVELPEWCQEIYEDNNISWVCTRLRGHPGDHVTCTEEAHQHTVWDNKYGQDIPREAQLPVEDDGGQAEFDAWVQRQIDASNALAYGAWGRKR